MVIRRAIAACAAAGTVMCAGGTPAAAAEDEKTGLAAALGLQAASGKTTIAEGGGAIEGAILSSNALHVAGRVIAALATASAEDRDVIVLSRAEQVNLMTADTVRRRIRAISGALGGIGTDSNKCVKPDADTALRQALSRLYKMESTSTDETAGMPAATAERAGPSGADIAAAFATDISYSPVALSLEDRMLIAAIAMSGKAHSLNGAPVWTPANYSWNTDAELRKPAKNGEDAAKPGKDGVEPAKDKPKPVGEFIIPSEIVALPRGGDANSEQPLIIDEYIKMTELADVRRHCNADIGKSLVAAADAYAKEITTPAEKTGTSQLAAARQAEAMLRRVKNPYLLRVAVEQVGGTAVTRANIWYTLGFPGAATIGAGLVTSFRLMDPASGVTKSAGFVRCAIQPVNMGNVHLVVNEDAADYFTKDSYRGRTHCSYVASPVRPPQQSMPHDAGVTAASLLTRFPSR
jgi:hypothetical protein